MVMKKLSVLINDEIVFEYDKERSFEEPQLAYLDRMDIDMDKGIKIYGELVSSPDHQQRGTFIAMNLIKALQQDNEASISASSAYLVNRFPDLTEVHARDEDNKVKIELVEE